MIAEEIARGDSGLADKLVQNWKMSVLLRKIAPRHLQEKWFPRLVAEPQFLLAHCLTEPRGASDRWLPYNVPEATMQTKAVKERRLGDQRPQAVHLQRLRRQPLRRLCQHQSKVGMLQGTSCFLVPRETPGFSVARCNETLGCRFMNNGEMVFEDMRVPEDHCWWRTARWARPASISAPARSSRRRRISASACAPSRPPPTTCRTTCRAAAS